MTIYFSDPLIEKYTGETMSANNLFIDYANNNLSSDVELRDKFLALSAVALVGGDVASVAQEIGITEDDDVWRHVADCLEAHIRSLLK